MALNNETIEFENNRLDWERSAYSWDHVCAVSTTPLYKFQEEEKC